MSKWNDDANGFVGVVHDSSESNNTIKASVKILSGNLKSKNDFTVLPFNEKLNVKKTGPDEFFCKYINIDHLYYYLSNLKDFKAVKDILCSKNGCTTDLPKEKEKGKDMPKGIGKEKEKLRANTNSNMPLENGDISSCKEDNFSHSIDILSNLVKYCATTDNTMYIKNDIIDNLIIDVSDCHIRNGCVFVDTPLKHTSIENNKNGTSNVLVHINNVFVFDKMKVLIKMNEIKMPTIIGRQYLLYSLNYTQSVTVTNILCAYEADDDIESFKNNTAMKYLPSQNSVSNKNSNAKETGNVLPSIYNPSNYKRINNIRYKKIDTRKCLRSYDIGIIEVEINNSGLLCAPKLNHNINYYISFDNSFFSIFDFFVNNISPLSRFVLADSSQIIASGLILDEGTSSSFSTD